MEIFGYYDKPGATKPAFDPGLGALCPFCVKPIAAPMKTISLMPADGDKSYFYRAHKACYETAAPEEITHIESLKIDPPQRIYITSMRRP